MPLHIYRVVVRGEFADLDPDVALDLRAHLDDHDLFRATYTKAGTFTYDDRLHAFSFRFECRISSDDGPEACAAEAQARAEALATEYLEHRGITYKRLRSTPTDMADMWREDA